MRGRGRGFGVFLGLLWTSSKLGNRLALKSQSVISAAFGLQVM